MMSSREFKRSSLTEFEKSLPGLIRARFIVTTELDRLVHDPMTGVINEDIVLNSKQRVEHNHVIQSPEYKKRQLQIKKKKKFNRKYGLEDESTSELSKIKECKTLLNKMGVILKRHEAYKPSLV